MPVIEGCKHSLEIEVPVEDVKAETERVLSNIQKRATLPGFRPGKAPASIIRTRFSETIRQEVLEHLVPKAFRARTEQDLGPDGYKQLREEAELLEIRRGREYAEQMTLPFS